MMVVNIVAGPGLGQSVCISDAAATCTHGRYRRGDAAPTSGLTYSFNPVTHRTDAAAKQQIQ